MGTVYNRFDPHLERERFPVLNPNGMRYYSGSDVHVLFNNILVDEIDSIGFQLAQNIRPVYPYHSHVWGALQHGTRLGQGYFELHTTDSAYLPAILMALERQMRQGDAAVFKVEEPKRPVRTLKLGTTLEAALQDFGNASDWNEVSDAYTASRFGFAPKEQIPSKDYLEGVFPSQPNTNTFRYDPDGSYLRAKGFTISVLYGDFDAEILAKFINGGMKKDTRTGKWLLGDSETYHGTIHQLHNVHIIAGPNSQITQGDDAVTELYTILARDIT